MAGQAITLPGVGTLDFQKIQKDYEGWLRKQPLAIEAAVTALQSSIQGLAIGFMLGSVAQMDPTAGKAGAPNAMAAMQTGTPLQQALNLGTLTGVNAGLSLVIKRLRNNKEDVWGAMGASFGSGAAYSIVSGAPNPGQAALTTGFAFAVFNGLFYQEEAYKSLDNNFMQIGKQFSGDPAEETEYVRGKHLLKTLGLSKYEKSLQNGKLTDNTIMLWNERALQEVKIPPGPRLLILHHLDSYRNPSNILKPALPMPMPPAPPTAPQSL